MLLLDKENEIRLKQFVKYSFSKKSDKYKKYKDVKKIIICLAADYGNLGDVAITYAQKKFLKESFPEYKVIEFPISRTFSDLKSLEQFVDKEDIITIVGGGNIGDMYDDIEFCRQLIIKRFHNNQIISFPQTIDFSKNPKGLKSRKKAFKIYNKHPNFKIFAREENSFNILKQYFPKEKIGIAPDIVLSIENLKFDVSNRSGLILCLRNDEEKKMNDSDQETIVDYMKTLFNIKFYDTHIPLNNMSIQTKNAELKKIWDEFSKAELVITDRLHGMIFCAITGTPCIAINNSNGKVQGVYDLWLKELNYIECINEFDLTNVKKALKTFDLTKQYEFGDKLKKVVTNTIILNN